MERGEEKRQICLGNGFYFWAEHDEQETHKMVGPSAMEVRGKLEGCMTLGLGFGRKRRGA